MRRLVLLSIGLFALLWAAERTGLVIHDDARRTFGVATGLHADDADAPGTAGEQWRALHHPVAAVTETIWKFAPVHAALGALRGVRQLDVALSASSPDPPIRPAPPYLRHTPLLI